MAAMTSRTIKKYNCWQVDCHYYEIMELRNSFRPARRSMVFMFVRFTADQFLLLATGGAPENQLNPKPGFRMITTIVAVAAIAKQENRRAIATIWVLNCFHLGYRIPSEVSRVQASVARPV